VAAKEERSLEAPAQQCAQGEGVARGAGQVQHKPRPVEPREAIGVRSCLLLRVEVDERRPICAAPGRLRHSYRIYVSSFSTDTRHPRTGKPTCNFLS
jgi:hypothetical protein